MKHIKRIAINTGGGDAPGLNAVIHAAVYAARNLGWEIFGIRDSLEGLIEPDTYPDGGLVKLTRNVVHNIAHLGGTILGTSNCGRPRLDDVGRRIAERQIDALISVGGDGTLGIARELHERGVCVAAHLEVVGDFAGLP